jgi:hypothetical protein
MTVAALGSVNTSEHRSACTKGRHGPTQQTDLFGGRPSTVVDTPAWQDLPAATQAVLTSLMARLFLDHAETCRAGSTEEAGHDL